MRTLLIRSVAAFASLFIFFNAYSQIGPAIKWQKSIGGSSTDYGRDILPTPDGGFLVVGETNSYDGNVTDRTSGDTTDAWVVKLNGQGDLLWSKTYGGNGADYFTSIYAAGDGNYYCVGTTGSNNGDVNGFKGWSDYWVVKINGSGSILWSKCYGGSSRDAVGDAAVTPDGGLVIFGESYSTDGDWDYTADPFPLFKTLVIKINSSGAVQWTKGLSSALEKETGKDIVVGPDGHYAIIVNEADTASSYISTFFFYSTALYKINKDNGSIMFRRRSHWELGMTNASIIADPSGYTISTDGQYLGCEYNQRLTRYSLSGDSLSSFLINPCNGSWVTANRHDFAPRHGIGKLNDTTYYSAGKAAGPTFPSRNTEASVLIGSVPSKPANIKSFGGSSYDEFTSMKALPGGSEFIAVGYSGSNDFDVSGNHGGYDMWVVKLVKGNAITGQVFVDKNSNGVKDAGEVVLKTALVKTEKTGFTQFGLPKNTTGFYQNDVDTGSYVTSVVVDKPYYSIVPASKATTFTSYNLFDTVHFALQPIAGKKDYAVSAAATGQARPGFNVGYQLFYANNGTDTLNKTLVFVKDSNLVFQSASPAQSAISGDTLKWNLSNVLPGGSGSISIIATLKTIPTVSLGQLITSKLYIDSTFDLLPSDNSALVTQTVTGSYDPNDKQESNNGAVSPKEIIDGKKLTYTIRFQNTGNDTAFNIVVRDTLDEKLDINSFEMIGASHAYKLNIKDGKYAAWVFENIKLVDSIHNEPLSHGYITYRIKPKAGLVLGDKINNSASIYFDFNPAIKTNTHETVVKNPIIAPSTPLVSGLSATYCSTGGVQKGKLTNLPASGSGLTTTVKLDATTLAIGSDSSFSFNVTTLASGNHSVVVSYSNGTDTKTATYNFSITPAVTPDVNVSSTVTNIINLTDAVTLTATNAAGGGTTPQYTFAKDRSFTNLLQAEGTGTTYAVNTTTLPMGDNWIYVRMKTSLTCYTAQTGIDSIKLYKLLVPDQPTVTGIDADYCSTLASIRKGKITNMPAPEYLATVSAKLDGTTTLAIAADSTFSITPGTLSAGNHSIAVTSTNASGNKSTTINFTVTAALTPDVNVSSTITNIVNLVDPVVVSASNAAAGGTAPLYTFAKDKAMTNILQAESATSTLSIVPSTFIVGDNWIYVKMKSNANCVTATIALDSINVKRSSVTGIRDVDFPNQVINIYPNPFRRDITINGLSTAKKYTVVLTNYLGQEVYRKRVENNTMITISRNALLKGTYLLSIYDEKKKKLIGSATLVRE